VAVKYHNVADKEKVFSSSIYFIRSETVYQKENASYKNIVFKKVKASMPSPLLTNVNKLRYLGTEVVKEAAYSNEVLTARAIYDALPVVVPKRLQRTVDQAVVNALEDYDVDPTVFDELPYRDVAVRYLNQSGRTWDIGALVVLATAIYTVGQNLTSW
jgi:hypothetical protein